VRDTILRVPPGVTSPVVEVRVFNRHGIDKDQRALSIERAERTLRQRRAMTNSRSWAQHLLSRLSKSCRAQMQWPRPAPKAWRLDQDDGRSRFSMPLSRHMRGRSGLRSDRRRSRNPESLKTQYLNVVAACRARHAFRRPTSDKLSAGGDELVSWRP